MVWFNHPSYARLRNRLIERFQDRVFIFRNSRQLIFICGAAKSERRNYLAGYFRRKYPNRLFFYADDVWSHIAKSTNLNALEMEEQLAQLADGLIIIVESPGTFTEFGAFSMSSKLREKLLPLLDNKYQNEASFINTGPVKWVDKESVLKPTMYVDFSSILTSVREIDKRLKKVHSKSIEVVTDLAHSPKHLLFLLMDLLTIIAPVCEEHISAYLKRIIGETPAWNTNYLLGFGIALQRISSFDFNNTKYYYRIPIDDLIYPYFHKDMFSLSKERAVFQSTLLKIPSARSVIEDMGRQVR